MGMSDRERGPWSGVPSKVLGNGLRELDRFLSVLIDEVAAATDIDDDALAMLRTRRNTANKLRMLNVTLGRDSPDHRRLRALGRSRDCFFYCGGLVRRADSRAESFMTTGWPNRSVEAGSALMKLPLGRRLTLDHADIADICRFYDRLADELLAASRPFSNKVSPPPLKSVAFSREYAHISLAIVACDGL